VCVRVYCRGVCARAGARWMLAGCCDDWGGSPAWHGRALERGGAALHVEYVSYVASAGAGECTHAVERSTRRGGAPTPPPLSGRRGCRRSPLPLFPRGVASGPMRSANLRVHARVPAALLARHGLRRRVCIRPSPCDPRRDRTLGLSCDLCCQHRAHFGGWDILCLRARGRAVSLSAVTRSCRTQRPVSTNP